MIKKHILILITLLISCTHLSRAQSVLWGKKGGSSDSNPSSPPLEEVKDIAVDAHGNFYVLAQMNQGISAIDGVPVGGIAGQGDGDVVLASYRCDGSFRWVKSIGTTRPDIPYTIGVDNKDGVYISIYASLQGGGTYICKIDKDTTIPQNNKECYIIKYDTSGKFQWYDSPQPDTVSGRLNPFTYPMSITFNDNDDVEWLCMWPEGRYGGASNSYIITKNKGLYITHYSSSGTFQGMTPLDIEISGTTSRDTRMVRNPRNGYYYVGARAGSPNDEITIAGHKVTGWGYLACFDRNGKNLWYQECIGEIGIQPAFAIDDQSNIYVAGGVNDTLSSFAGMKFHFTGNQTYGRPMVMKLDSTGKALWGIVGNETFVSTGGSAVGLRNSGELFVAGEFGTDLGFPGYPRTFYRQYKYQSFLMRVSTQTGKIFWMDTVNSATNGDAPITFITSDKRNSVLFGGNFSGDLSIAGRKMSISGGRTDFWFARYGYNCGCKEIPQSAYTWYQKNDSTAVFQYTGSAYTSIAWDFGDGTTSADPNPTHTYSSTGIHQACVTVRNACGDHSTCYILPMWPTAIKDSRKAEISIYPNPATEQLVIEGMETGTKAEIVDMLGRQIYSGTFQDGKAVVNTSALAPGAYTIRLTTPFGYRDIKKIIKQ